MIKLIGLEWKKWDIKKHIRNVVIMEVALLLFLIATAGKAGADIRSIGFYDKSVINTAVELYSNMTFAVYTGVMIASFIVAEYEKGTIGLMFSYPIKRKDIFLSKIVSVWFFCVVSLILCKLSIYSVLKMIAIWIDNISTTDIPYDFPVFWLDMVLGSIIIISIAFIALPVGMKTKSSKITVISSVFVACFSHGNIMGYTLLGNVYYYMLLILLDIVFICKSLRKVEYDDVS